MDSFHSSLFTQWHFYLVFYSKFAENILVFTAAIDWYDERSIYFWARDAKSSNAEVDYLVTSGSTVYPVEVGMGSDHLLVCQGQ